MILVIHFTVEDHLMIAGVRWPTPIAIRPVLETSRSADVPRGLIVTLINKLHGARRLQHFGTGGHGRAGGTHLESPGSEQRRKVSQQTFLAAAGGELFGNQK